MVPGSYYDRLLDSAGEEQCMDFLYYDGQLVVTRGNERIPEEELCGLISVQQEGSRGK